MKKLLLLALLLLNHNLFGAAGDVRMSYDPGTGIYQNVTLSGSTPIRLNSGTAPTPSTVTGTGSIVLSTGGTLAGSTISGSTTVSGTLSGNLTRSGTTTGGSISGGTLLGTTTNSGTISGGTLLAGSGTIQSNSIYYGVSFIDNNLMPMASGDGIHWSTVGPCPGYTSGTSTRDPSVLYTNNAYYVAFTYGDIAATMTTFRIAKSNDYVNYSAWATVDMSSVPSVARVYAPEFFQNSGTTFCSVSTSTTGTGPFKGYIVPATSADLSTWGTPVLITGTGLPASYFDTQIIQVASGSFRMVYRNLIADAINWSSASAPGGPYNDNHVINLSSVGSVVEGPSMVQISGTTWRLYTDRFTRSGYYYSESSDDWTTWSTQTLCTSPMTMGHFSIVKTNDVNVANNILSAALSASPNPIVQYGNQIGIGYFNGTLEPSFPLDIRTASGTSSRLALTSPSGLDSGIIFDAAGSGNNLYISRKVLGGFDVIKFVGGTNDLSMFGSVAFSGTGLGVRFTATTSTAVTGTIALSSYGNAPLYWSGTAATSVVAFTGGNTGIEIPIFNTGTVALTFTTTNVIHTNGGGTITINAGDKATAASYVISGTTFWNVGLSPNYPSGTVTLTGGSGSVVNSSITTSSIISTSIKTPSGAATPLQVQVFSGSATFTGAATDAGTYNWAAIKVN